MAQITSFGLFWRRDEVEWEPGQGFANVFRLAGRIGENRPSRRICDFRKQQGIYILYDEHGPTYVGLSGRRKDRSALGQRLKEHVSDRHEESWSRFSWFGFDPVSPPDQTGMCLISERASVDESSPVSATIRDTEALIMQILRPRDNRAITKFTGGEEWTQIELDGYEKFFG